MSLLWSFVLPFPDVSIIDTLAHAVTARVLLTQRYVNNAPSATARAKYVFPVPSRAAVCAFELTHADGRVIVGEAKEKTQAADEHAEALKEGRVTALVEWATDDGESYKGGLREAFRLTERGYQCSRSPSEAYPHGGA